MHSCVAYTRKIFKLNPRHVCRLVDIFASRWKWVSSVSDSVRFAFPAHVISLFASKGIEIHNSYQYFPSPPRPPLPSFLSPFFTPFFFFFLPSSDACKSAYCHPFEYVRLIETRRHISSLKFLPRNSYFIMPVRFLSHERDQYNASSDFFLTNEWQNYLFSKIFPLKLAIAVSQRLSKRDSLLQNNIE